jgi:hypothetical protein
MINSRIKSLLAEEASGENSMAHTREITQYHRGLGSWGDHTAAAYLMNYMREERIQAVLLEAPLDNKTKTVDWVHPFAWQPRDAILKVMEPEERILVTFWDTPTCINSWSASTPAEGVVAELVYVGEGTSDEDYAGKDVRGKVVFVDRGYTWRTHGLAVEKYGALGFINDDIQEIPYLKTRELHPDFVLWQTLYERELDGGQNQGWGLTISPRMGDYVRELLDKGEVKVYVKIEAETFEGIMQAPMGTIEGREFPEEEILMSAHLCHTKPGALDNAAGCGAITEVLRAINALVERGEIARPKRSIKTIIGPEGLALQVYFDGKGENLDDVIVALGPCGGSHPEKNRGPLVLGTTSVALPHFMNDLCADILDELPDYFPAPGPVIPDPSSNVYQVRRGSLSGDGMSINAWNIPCVDINREGGVWWHTQFDTVDKADAGEFRKLQWVHAVAALTVADAEPKEAVSIMCSVEGRSEDRLNRVAAEAREELASVTAEEAGHVLERCIDRLRYSRERDAQAIASTLVLVRSEREEVRARLQHECDRLSERLLQKEQREEKGLREFAELLHGELVPPEPELLPTEAQWRPRLRKRGWIDLKLLTIQMGDRFETVREGARKELEFILKVYEICSLSSGERTIAEMGRILVHEGKATALTEIIDVVSELEQLGYMDVER